MSPSFLSSLKTKSMIPSNAYGYTAGASYQLDGVVGSLTLGGYDASRFTSNNLTFPFFADDSRFLTAGLQSIVATDTLDGSTSLLPDGILVLIDSMVSEIWLPKSACALFEQAFGLQFDPNTSRYLVNDTIHSKLRSANPSVTFQPGTAVSGGATISIKLPYSAFDLTAKWPIYPSETNYFPLRRAANDTQYVLGRTSFQEAYVIADYERSSFSISQCHFANNESTQLIAIEPTADSTPSPNPISQLSTGKTSAISVAAAVVLLLLAMGGLFYNRRIKKKRNIVAQGKRERDELEEAEALQMKEVHVKEIHEVDAPYPHEMADDGQIVELRGTSMSHELRAEAIRAELPAEDVTAQTAPRR